VSEETLSKLPSVFHDSLRAGSIHFEQLRAEFRVHLDSAVADIQAGGVSHDDAVDRAIAQFGNAKKLRKMLSRDYGRTVGREIGKAEDFAPRDNKKQVGASIFWGLLVGGSSWAALFGEHAPWIWLFFGFFLLAGTLIGYIQTQVPISDRLYASIERMAAMYRQPLIPGSSLGQRFRQSVMKALIDPSRLRGRPSGRSVLVGSIVSTLSLIGLWSMPLNQHERLMFFYTGAAFVGQWIGSVSARFSMPTQRSTAAANDEH